MTANIADFFAELWENLKAHEEDVLVVSEVPANSALRLEVRNLIESKGLQADEDLRQWLKKNERKLPGGELGAMLLVAREIDRWCAPLRFVQNLDPGEARGSLGSQGKVGRVRGLSADLIWIGRTLKQYGRLNEMASDWLVIPKFPRWGKWSNQFEDPELPKGFPKLAGLFDYLMVLPAQIDATDPDDKSQTRKIVFTFKMLDEALIRKGVPDEEPVIGIAPIAQEPDDIQVVLSSDTSHWYDVQPRDLNDRASDVIRELCARNVNIIVIPEMTVTPGTLDRIKVAIKKYGPNSKLRLVVAGTKVEASGSMPYNEAVLFNHMGRELGRHRKLHRWNLDRVQRKRFGFDVEELDRSSELLRELINPGEKITIWEIAHLGRTSVLICEDLSRPNPGQWLQTNLLLDWIFVPILDGSIELGRWVCRTGAKAALAGRCRVVVANSISMTHRAMLPTFCGPPDPNCGIGVCIDVRGQDYQFERVAVPLIPPLTEGAYAIVPWLVTGWTFGDEQL